jgi:predicted nucleic acid-binding protein
MIEFPSEARIYIDTNIWIYFLEGHPTFASKVRALFTAASTSSSRLCTSEMAIAECLMKPARERDARKVAAYDTLFGDRAIEILPLDGALARRAALAGGALGLKLIDAIHFVSAREARCRYFLTGDSRFKSVTNMTVIGLD